MAVIEFFDETGEIMIARQPQEGSGSFKLGTQLVVQESQVAFFVRDGQILDGFKAGRHTLETRNLPGLTKLVTGLGRSPFRAHVCFLALKTFINLGWGTASPVTFRDSEFRMVAIRAHGAFSVRIQKPRLFMQTLVGTKGLEYTHGIEEYFRQVIVSRFNEVLGRKITTILDLPAHYNEIALGVREAVKDDFDQYGVELVDLLIEAITPPPAVQEMINRATGIEAQDISKYSAVAQADALREAAKNPGGGASDGLGAGLGLAMGLGMMQHLQQNPGAAAPGGSGNPAAPAASQPGASPPPVDIKAKLRELKELRDDELITEEDFQQQKQRLLDQL